MFEFSSSYKSRKIFVTMAMLIIPEFMRLPQLIVSSIHFAILNADDKPFILSKEPHTDGVIPDKEWQYSLQPGEKQYFFLDPDKDVADFTNQLLYEGYFNHSEISVSKCSYFFRDGSEYFACDKRVPEYKLLVPQYVTLHFSADKLKAFGTGVSLSGYASLTRIVEIRYNNLPHYVDIPEVTINHNLWSYRTILYRLPIIWELIKLAGLRDNMTNEHGAILVVRQAEHQGRKPFVVTELNNMMLSFFSNNTKAINLVSDAVKSIYSERAIQSSFF